MSAWHRGDLVVLAVLCVTASCAATQQQQQQPSAVSITTGDELLALIARAVRVEMRTVISKLESKIESLDGRLLLLDSRVDAITVRLLENSRSPLQSRVDDLSRKLELLDSRVDRLHENSQSPQLDELSSRLDGQQSQLDELVAKLDRQTPQLDMVTSKTNSQESQLDEVDIKVNGQKSQLDGIASKMNNETPRVENLTTRVASQESQVAGLVTDLDHQQNRLVLLNDTTKGERPRLDGATNKTASQQAQIDEPTRVEQRTYTNARDCSELPAGATTGIHLLRPLQSTVEAYCDMDTDGGRWTVFQRRNSRVRPIQDFYLGWTYYKEGFGNLTGEFWWGLDYLWQLTSAHDRRFELRIDLDDFYNNTAHAVYQDFSISSEEDGYRLSASNYRGDAGDSLRYSVNEQFSTPDRDQDSRSWGSCSEHHQGAWWYNDCTASNLNGRDLGRSGGDRTVIWWITWRSWQFLKKTEMKIRPI